ncbi:MAG TPA: ATP-binding protein [Methylomirabilota bacterium]|nr:ATP-binding protein [Methylomirabilota bacterium]
MPRAVRDPLGYSTARRPPVGDSFPWAYLLVFLLGVAVALGYVYYSIESERRVAIDQWRARLSILADDRARLIGNWLNARRADGEVVASFPSVRALLSTGRSDEGLTPYLNRVAQAYGYSSIVVYDAQGRWVARSTGAAELGGENVDALLAAARNQETRIALLGDKPERRLLTVVVPVFSDGGTVRSASSATRVVLGVVSLRMLPETGLYPLLTDESSRTRTGETLVFTTEGDPVYLSPLRQSPAGWSAVGRSLETLRDWIRAASRGQDPFGEMTDYRAVQVLGAARLIHPTGWGLVLKIDREEALEEFYRSGKFTGILAVALLLALALLLYSLWRQQQRAHLLRAQMRQERAIFNLKGYAEKIVASVPSGLLLLSADLRILSANRSFLESFQVHQDDVLGRDLQEVVRAEGLLRRAREVLQSGVAQHDILFDLGLAMRAETRPVRVTMTNIRMAEEEGARLLLIIEDLTEEERLQAAHQASEQRFRDLVQGLDAIVWEADAATLRFSFVSQRAQIVLGYPVDRWLRERDFWVTRIHPDDRERAMKVCREALAKGEDHEFEYRSIAADGREVWLRDIVHVVTGAEGRPGQLRGLTVDITELKRAEDALRQSEEQLRQVQKMDAVGKLAGGIAHDFNNLLMVIRGDADLILRRLAQGHPLRQNADGIREAADQAATLTRQLLAFSRKQVIAPTILDVNGIVAGIHKMLQRLLGETINLVTVTAPDLWKIRADAGQVEQMVLNLAVNARDAMPDGGRLTIRTSNVELDEITARRRGGAQPGQYVMLEVSDTGVGMDAETKARIFEPFFTTKDVGKGTGLGLSTVYGIINQNAGHIWVESEPGRGTTFRVYLPRVEEAVAVPARDARPDGAGVREEAMAPTAFDDGSGGPLVEEPPRPKRGETILLVEDAQRVRAVVREILEMNGYTVLEARHGAEALEVSGKHQGPIHLMVTDVVMPQMSGRELAQKLQPLRSEMRVLYMSGYTDDAIVRHGVLGAGMAFLSKPFTPDALATKVREVLDGAPVGAPAAGGSAPRPDGPGPRPSHV